jgi:hypothetical protein
LRHGIDTALPPLGGLVLPAVTRQRTLGGGEEIFQRTPQPGLGGHGAFKDRLRVARVVVGQQPPEVGEHGAGVSGMVPGCQVGGELGQPRW